MKFVYKNSDAEGIPSVIQVEDDYILKPDESWEAPSSNLFKPTLVDGQWTGISKAEFEKELAEKYPAAGPSELQEMIAALTQQVTLLTLEVSKLEAVGGKQ